MDLKNFIKVALIIGLIMIMMFMSVILNLDNGGSRKGAFLVGEIQDIDDLSNSAECYTCTPPFMAFSGGLIWKDEQCYTC